MYKSGLIILSSPGAKQIFSILGKGLAFPKIMTEQAFQQLTGQIQRGDEQGLKYVFEQSSHYCVRTLIKKTRCSQADAEDIFMDAILVFRENILANKLKYLSNLKTYIFGICWNLWRDLQRAEERWSKAHDEVERQLQLLLSQDNVPFSQDESELIQRRVKWVSEALALLGEKCRKLLTYVYVEQRPQKDIAELMGFASPNVVKVTRHRCHQQWSKHIEQLKPQYHGSI